MSARTTVILRWVLPPLLLSIVGMCITMNWLKLGAFWGDAPRSLFEIYRVARGEGPYRDFSYPYPPFALALFGLVFHWLGATFLIAQLTLDVLSLACVFAFLALARGVAAPLPSYAATIAFVLVGATSGNTFALFSLGVYTPAVLTGAIGLLLACLGLMTYVRSGFTVSTITSLTCGGLVSCLSRPECLVAILLGLLCLGLIEIQSAPPDGKLGKLLRICTLTLLLLAPSACVYLFLSLWIGYRPLLEGITGYGLASASCPWWPTGFGLCSAVAALAGAVACFGVLDALVRIATGRSLWASKLRYSISFAAGIGWILFHILFFEELTSRQSNREGLISIANLLISTNTVLLPIMWASCALLFVEMLSYLRKGRVPRSVGDKTLFILLGVVFGLSLRSLFNSSISNVTMVTPLHYPLLMALTLPLSLYAALKWSGPGPEASPMIAQRVQVWGAVALVLFGAGRLAGSVVRDAKKQYFHIVTEAGAVKLNDRVSADVYDFLKTNTLVGEQIADVAYGGGLNFALHRASPLYSTQFVMFRPSAEQRWRDYAHLRANRTRFVISQKPPLAKYGTGHGCSFPRFVWMAPAPPEDAGVIFPVMQFIEARYYPIVTFAGVSVYQYDLTKTDNFDAVR
jgi:hypothetical protein